VSAVPSPPGPASTTLSPSQSPQNIAKFTDEADPRLLQHTQKVRAAFAKSFKSIPKEPARGPGR